VSSKVIPSGPAAYKRAADLLSRGGLVALPTETVYGLAGDARNDEAVKRIYKAKGRPAHNPLIAHILDPQDASVHAEISPLAQTLIDAFWPGPLTLVLPRRPSDLSIFASAGLTTIALRCPNTEWRSALLELGVKGPLFMPSANLSGRTRPTQAQHVLTDMENLVDLIIDDGPCQFGVESTVLKIEGETAILLRPGSLTAEDFLPFISDLRLASEDSPVAAPGMLKSHYAPRAKVRLNARDKRDGEAYLAFGPTPIDADANLSAKGDLTEATQNLFALVRVLDKPGIDTIAVAPIPYGGLGDAINDRLQRAAAKR